MTNTPTEREGEGAWTRLRSNMDVAEYEHVVLGLIFLKSISGTFLRDRSNRFQAPTLFPAHQLAPCLVANTCVNHGKRG